VRPAVPPPLVAMETLPEAEIAILIALHAFENNYATPAQFDVLLDVRDLLLLAADAVENAQVVSVCRDSGKTLLKIRQSFDGKNFSVLPEDLAVLKILINTSKAFWSLHSALLYRAAYKGLCKWREEQAREKNEAV
jgi:hypothetical protein